MIRLSVVVGVMCVVVSEAMGGLVSQSTNFFNTDNGGTAAATISGPIFCTTMHSNFALTELGPEFGGSMFAITIDLRGKWVVPTQPPTSAMSNLAAHPQTSNSQYVIEEQWLSGGILHYDHPVIVGTYITNQFFTDAMLGAIAAEVQVTGGVCTAVSCNVRRNQWVGGGVPPAWFQDWTALISVQGNIVETGHFEFTSPEPATLVILLGFLAHLVRRR
jgi:hypothetical protein